MKRIIGIVMTVIFTIIMMPMQNVKAWYLSSMNFDYEWYLEQHPDLAAIYTSDQHDEIWKFYSEIGKNAGWNGKISKASYFSKTSFDFDYFAEHNPDVVEFYSGDQDAIYDWFITTGIKEGRLVQTTSEYTNAILKIYDIAKSITNDKMTERDKVKAVHDWLCINVAYDEENYYAGTIPSSSYTITGPIFYGKAVCAGYAETFQEFMDVLGIECYQVIGTATNSAGRTGNHAWNRVKVDGTWYWIDVTWDDPVPDRPGIVYRYDYFLISESQMNINHHPNK